MSEIREDIKLAVFDINGTIHSDDSGIPDEVLCGLAHLQQQVVMKSNGLQIVQQFHKGKKIPISYTENGQVHNTEVRVRLTPYADPKTGKLVSAKATGRSGTDFIHASSDSVNTAVGVQ